jgi:hypothetical protein
MRWESKGKKKRNKKEKSKNSRNLSVPSQVRVQLIRKKTFTILAHFHPLLQICISGVSNYLDSFLTKQKEHFFLIVFLAFNRIA